MSKRKQMTMDEKSHIMSISDGLTWMGYADNPFERDCGETRTYKDALEIVERLKKVKS